MTLIQEYQKAAVFVMRIFRWDLQLHFFWGFTLTLLGVYWLPLYGAGITITVIKELLDVWSKGSWSWGDFWWGIVGSATAILFLYTRGCDG